MCNIAIMKRFWMKKKTGKHIVHFPNGNKKEEGNYKNGKEVGNCTWWYENGQKCSEGTFKDGIKMV